MPREEAEGGSARAVSSGRPDVRWAALRHARPPFAPSPAPGPAPPPASARGPGGPLPTPRVRVFPGRRDRAPQARVRRRLDHAAAGEG